MKYIAKDLGEAAEISRGKTDLKSALKGFVSIAIGIAVIVFTVHITARLLAENMPDKIEQQWFAPFMQALFFYEAPPQPPPQRAQGIFTKVLASACQQTTCRDLDYRLRYQYHSSPNAYAVIGGDTVITDELYQLLETEAGLAFILAHEIVHHNKRHVMHSLTRNILWTLLLALAGITGDVHSSLYFAEMGYSRAYEKEADLLALQIVYPLYGDVPNDYLEFFTHLQRSEADNHTEVSEWISSHPNIENRIAYLREALKELKQGYADK